MKLILTSKQIPEIAHLPWRERHAIMRRHHWAYFRHWQGWLGLAAIKTKMCLARLRNMLGMWNVGILECWASNPPQPPIIPIFQHSSGTRAIGFWATPALFLFGFIAHSYAGFVYQADYDIVGFGEHDELIVASQIPIGSVAAFEYLEVELAHSYASEIVLSLTAPSGEEFFILNGNGARTRIGAGTGLLDGTEVYRFVAPGSGFTSVESWDFTGYQPGGTYDAAEWPLGAWDAGTWTLAVFNDDVSSFSDGVVGSVTLAATLIPEPATGAMVLFGFGVILYGRSRCSRITAISGVVPIRMGGPQVPAPGDT